MTDGQGQSLRLAILCSFNLELIAGSLTGALEDYGFSAELFFSDYGQWETVALDPSSKLYAFAPDIVILLADVADLAPSLAPDVPLPTDDAAAEAGDAAWRRVDAVVRALLQRLPVQATVLCTNAVLPSLSPLGLLESNSGYSAVPTVERFNQRLRERSRAEQRLIVVDYARLVVAHGVLAWTDRRLWHLGRMRLASSAHTPLATFFARYIAALRTPRRKCLVLDLDNTLWGGVIGEDGMTGIEVGHEGVGLAFRELQLAALALSRRGIILAVSSKNNVDDAMAVFRDHPDMVLRKEHFACMQIGWESKPEGLRRIAKKLNIGIDSLVFWDDNPVEREMMRQMLPEVLVPDVPDDPTDHAEALLDLACFDVLALTSEDAQRARMYREQAERAGYGDESAPASLDEFYASLNLEVAIEPVKPETIARTAQLTQRTNQFNFTTRRYSVNDIEAMAADPQVQIHTLRVRDRFGELGIVGVTIVRASDRSWTLDSFLMSCRALGRGVEDALLASVARRARLDGASLVGLFIPTPKNAPACEFLARHGVAPPAGWQGDAWEFPISLDLEPPFWIAQLV